MRHKGLGLLLVTLLVGVIAGSIVEEFLAVLFQAVGISKNSVVAQVLSRPLFVYDWPPTKLNLIVLTLTLGFSLDFGTLSLLGMVIAWYYFKNA